MLDTIIIYRSCSEGSVDRHNDRPILNKQTGTIPQVNRDSVISVPEKDRSLSSKAKIISWDDFNSNGKWDSGEDLVDINKDFKFITIGGSVTETIFKLGFGRAVIAVDQSSTFPDRVKNLPQVGYIRAIASEGVLSMIPTKIFTTSDIGPPNAVSQIKDSGVDIEIFDAPKTVDDIIILIDKLSTLLDAKAQRNIVVGEIQSDIVKIDNIISNYDKVPSMVFFMNPSSGGYMAAGKGTIADYLIDLMGGDNPFSDDFSKYQRVNKEEILKYDPDIILVASHGGDGKSSLHFTNGSEFKSLKSVDNRNVIDISMSNLTMGPSFISNTVSVMEKINIGFGK